MNKLGSLILGFEEFFNQPEIKAAKNIDEFSRIAPDVLARMEKSEIPAS